jgi:ribulose-phosphate 3-epimerase
MKLHPAILTDSMSTFVEQLDAVKDSDLIDRVHVDIIDGQFVDNITVTPLDLTVVEFGELKVEFHLMVEEPMDSVFECEAIREYLPIKRIIGQVEKMSHQADFIHEVQRNGWEVGLGLDIYTPLEAIDEASWLDIDAILLMGIEAGHQNQIFNVHVLQKVQEIHQQFMQTKKIDIILDGGVKLTNINRILQSGVDEVEVGSALWKSRDPVGIIDEFFKVAKH